MIFSGNLTETLKFYHQVETQSKSGFKTMEEQLYLTIRAQRLKNREHYEVDADELFHTSELTFRLRWRKEMDETDIVEYDGKRYRINSIDKYPKDNEVTIIISKINE
jgi:SPP1 family predicted phage head-tail adaptor